MGSTNYYMSGPKYRGINRAGAEYGDDWDGWTGQTYYVWPTASELTAELTYLDSIGFNLIRLPISWERLQHTLNGAFNAVYQTELERVVAAVVAAKFYCIIDVHNYNRYATSTHTGDQVQTQQSGYVQHVFGDGNLTNSHVIDLWTKLANLFKTNASVQFDLMNEAHDFNVTSDNYVTMVNAQIAAIRATGSTNLVHVPNSRGSDITHFANYSPNGGSDDTVALLGITDPANNYVFHVHQYQASPSSATSYRDLFPTITSWAQTNGKKLFLGELGVNPQHTYSQGALTTLLQYLVDNGDVWVGFSPWNLSPYKLTGTTYTQDGPMMPWYKPFLTPFTASDDLRRERGH